MRKQCVLWALVAFLLLIASWSRAEAPVISAAQIQADWLRQNELREHPVIYQKAKVGGVTPQEDAAGGCDGVKNGQWGFHTANEPRPWWRVDLGRPAALSHILIYNRGEAFAARAARLQVLVSDDDQRWKQVAQNPGIIFYGFSDGKPLRLKLNGATARYVRLQLPGTSYFHLDEVEIYAVDRAGRAEDGKNGKNGKNARAEARTPNGRAEARTPDGRAEARTPNIALGRPATQSSVSQWSAVHAQKPGADEAVRDPRSEYATTRVVERGLRLAGDLERRGVEVKEATAALRRIGEQAKKPKTADGARELFFKACAAVRGLALRNPLLDFDSVVFVKHAPTMFPHMSDQFYGWWSRPGGGVFVIEGIKGPEPKVRCLTGALPEGSFLRPDLSYDGKKILFAYCRSYPALADERNKADKANVPEDAFYHLYEIGADGTGLRRLTHGKYDDFNGIYLPGSSLPTQSRQDACATDIAFLSTRKGVALQCTQASAEATRTADLPDSYVRCGGDEYRPVPVFTMHAMNAEGGNLRPISAFENFEWTPAVASDGRILYTRWDYIDRFNGHFFSLWSTNPDGTNAQLVYGNYTMRPQVTFEARPIPNSTKLILTAGAHHSIVGGSLVLLDRTRGTEEAAPLVRLTPEVPFPETEAWADMYYANPYPLAEEHYLVSWSDRRLPPHRRVEEEAQNPSNAGGIYLYDAFGNLTLLYRDAALSSECPIPLRARPKPHSYPSTVEWAGPQEGSFMVNDVYQGLPGIARGTVKRLRVVAVPPKVQPRMNTPIIGVSREDPGKYVLGTAPVEADGSAYFRVPSGVPVFFQALDAQGLAVQTMRSLTYVQPKQTLACGGCHEPRESAPAGRGAPMAFAREPSRLTLGPAGSWPLSYDKLVQPVLDQNCVSCHAPGGRDPQAVKLDLTAPRSYDSLMQFGGKDLHNLAFERDRSAPGETTARKSKLFALLTTEKGHEGVRLDHESLDRLITWMDTYAQRAGHFSEQQAEEIGKFKEKLAPMLEAYRSE